MENTKEFYLKVGVNIRKKRLEKGIKQIDLAYDIDVRRQVMYRIEKGGINLTLNTLCKLATALGTTPADLIDVQSPLAP